MPWGTAYFQDDFPRRYDSNMAILDGDTRTATADALAPALDDLYGGFGHRQAEVASASDADAIAMGMAEHGYAIERLVTMAHRRDADRPPEQQAAEELGFAEYRGLNAEVVSREPWATDPDIVETMVEFSGVLAERVGARFFAQRVDGRFAGGCELYVEGDVAQIEDVNTLEEFRGRGIARNVVLRAAEEARAAGASFVFLFADGDDWPRHLYARIGFDEIGRGRLFTRWPEHHPGNPEGPGGVG